MTIGSDSEKGQPGNDSEPGELPIQQSLLNHARWEGICLTSFTLFGECFFMLLLPAPVSYASLQ